MEATPYNQGVFAAVKGAMGLFQDYNKISDVKADGSGEAPRSEYESSFKDKDILNLTKEWKATYSVYEGDIKPTQEISYNYWIGKQKTDPLEVIDGHDVVDNLIFEAVETFLPIANKANPDPLVSAGDSEAGIVLAKNVKNALVDQADKQKLRMKLKRGTRHWTLYRLGCWKVVWDAEKNDFDTLVINPKNLILDKDGYVDDAGHFTGEYIGEKKKLSASRLLTMFPNKEEQIQAIAKGKMGTKVEIVEWWYKGTDIFYTTDTVVLGKFKNPNWNYDGEETRTNPNTQQEETLEIIGQNHMHMPMAPYVFLSVFTTGDKPHDDTSLILQNIPMQDMINKRFRQIDKNADSQNNGALASGDAFTKEQAAEAATFLRKGGTVWVPNGDINTAWKRDAAPALPSDVYNQLADSRSELRNIFGISGSTPQGLQKQDTVRGKIMVAETDSSRIGGGVTEYIEQVADSIYNWWVQFMYVYYDEPHMIEGMGQNGAMETMAIRNSDFNVPVRVTVKEGSLIPKDPLTERNEAMDLWQGNAIGLPELYTRLDFPDPMASAKQTLIWQQVAQGLLPPQALFPDFPSAQVQAPIGVGTSEISENTSVEPNGQDSVGQQSSSLLSSVPIG